MNFIKSDFNKTVTVKILEQEIQAPAMCDYVTVDMHGAVQSWEDYNPVLKKGFWYHKHDYQKDPITLGHFPSLTVEPQIVEV